MKTRRVLTIIVSLLFVAIVALTSLSVLMAQHSGGGDGSPLFPKLPVAIGTPKVDFAAGSFPVDSTELSLVLQPGETALLEDFTELTSVDFSGSTCYEEILAWAEKHPNVTLRYTVALPGGQTVDSKVETLDFTALSSDELSSAVELLPYLPALKSVDLGSRSAADALSAEALGALQEALPEAEIRYAMNLRGQDYPLDTAQVDLSGMSAGETADAAAALACLPNVTNIVLGSEGSGLSWDDIALIHEAAPQAALDYSFTLFDRSLNLSDETLNFSHVAMDDQGAAVRRILPYMTRCTTLDMDTCGVSNENMNSIRQDFPNIHVIWRVWFGLNYSVRTDAERILASKPSVAGELHDEDVVVLQYCDGCKYLDLGHNESLTNVNFAYGMPNLEVAVIAMSPITDISALASCPHLEYLETQTTSITDLSPLSELKELRHLNICNCKELYDITPLYGLTELERLYIGCITPIPQEQVEEMQRRAPDCEINTEVFDPTTGHWRITGYTELSLLLYDETGWLQEVLHPRYELLREQFGYTDADYAFYWNDPLY